MSATNESQLREMYHELNDAMNDVADALNKGGEPYEQVVEAAREIKSRVLRAESEQESAQRFCNIMRDYYVRETQLLRNEIDTLRREVMMLTVERDMLRRIPF